MSRLELKKELNSIEKELVLERMAVAAGKSAHFAKISSLKKDLARILTLMDEKKDE